MACRGDPGELAAHQVVIYDQRASGATWTFRQETTEVTVHVNGRLRVTPAEGVREGVLAGLELSIGGSEWLFAPELKSGKVLSVLDDWSLPSMSLWAIFPTGRQTSAKPRTFVRFSEQQISDNRRDGTLTHGGTTRSTLHQYGTQRTETVPDDPAHGRQSLSCSQGLPAR
jgi:DNA-binding transcriptional LysR family regulator